MEDNLIYKYIVVGSWKEPNGMRSGLKMFAREISKTSTYILYSTFDLMIEMTDCPEVNLTCPNVKYMPILTNST